MRVVVVGAGVGGLAAARGLSRAGHDVVVLERAQTLRTTGAAVTLWSNGTGIVESLGIPLAGVGGRIDVLEQRTWSGRRLLRVEVSRATRRHGRPDTCVPRRVLVGLLADGLPAGTIRFGSEVTGFSHDDDGVTVELADGDRVTGDVLVGADGHASVVRTALWQTDHPAPAGWVTWQGLNRIPVDVTEGRTNVMLVGPEGMCGLMPAGDGLLQWWFDVRRTEPLRPESPVEDLRRRFGHWASPVPEVLAAVTDDDVEPFPHRTHRVPRVWGAGRCTLVGDAAHSMPPTRAQGANQALEDAWLLCHALGDRDGDAGESPDVAGALRRYERRRSVRAGRVARASATESTNLYRPVLTSLIPGHLAAWAWDRWLRRVSDFLAEDPGARTRAGAGSPLP